MTAWMRLTCLAGIAAAAFGGANAALAGGQMNFGDETNTSANDGPPFFGFIRDSNGSSIPGAKVTATVKSGGALVTRSNSMGVYKIPGFAKEIDPKDVTISCDKDGYKQASTLRRPPSDPKDPIEVECTLQKE